MACDMMELFDRLFSIKRKLDPNNHDSRNRDRYVGDKKDGFHSFHSISDCLRQETEGLTHE